MKMSVWSLSCQQSVFQRYITVKNIFESFTHKMATKASWHRNYVTVTLCICFKCRMKLAYRKPWVCGNFVARCCRQGTVSELLSKPKHWDKLTEKGRDSYRRMHQWIRDGGNIAALKAYAPKKGQPSRPLSRRRSPNSPPNICPPKIRRKKLRRAELAAEFC